MRIKQQKLSASSKFQLLVRFLFWVRRDKRVQWVSFRSANENRKSASILVGIFFWNGAKPGGAVPRLPAIGRTTRTVPSKQQGAFQLHCRRGENQTEIERWCYRLKIELDALKRDGPKHSGLFSEMVQRSICLVLAQIMVFSCVKTRQI